MIFHYILLFLGRYIFANYTIQINLHCNSLNNGNRPLLTMLSSLRQSWGDQSQWGPFQNKNTFPNRVSQITEKQRSLKGLTNTEKPKKLDLANRPCDQEPSSSHGHIQFHFKVDGVERILSPLAMIYKEHLRHFSMYFMSIVSLALVSPVLNSSFCNESMFYVKPWSSWDKLRK